MKGLNEIRPAKALFAANLNPENVPKFVINIL